MAKQIKTDPGNLAWNWRTHGVLISQVLHPLSSDHPAVRHSSVRMFSLGKHYYHAARDRVIARNKLQLYLVMSIVSVMKNIFYK